MPFMKTYGLAKGGGAVDRSIDIQGTHAGPWAPHAGADCPHPMNPCPRGAPGPTRRVRAACAATAGFCARFAALGPVLGGWPRAGCSTSTMARDGGPPKPFNSPNNATGRKIRPIWKACSPICSQLACTPFWGPKNGTFAQKKALQLGSRLGPTP